MNNALFTTRLLFSQLRLSLLGSFFVAFILFAYIFNNHLSTEQMNTPLFIWFGLMSFTLIARYLHYYYFLNQDDNKQKSSRCINIFRLGVVLTACIWASVSFTFLDQMSLTSQFIFVIILMGLSTGAMNSLSSDYFSYAAFISALLLPFSLHNFNSDQKELVFLGILSFILLTFLLLIGRKLTKTITESYLLRQEKDHLIDKLSQEKSSLNQRLRTLFDNESHEIYLFDSNNFQNIRINKGAAINNQLNKNIKHGSTLNQLLGHLSDFDIKHMLTDIYEKKAKFHTFQNYLYRSDGSRYFVEAQFQLLEGQSKPILYLSAFDASSNKNYRQKTLEQESIIKSILASNPMFLARLSIDGEFLFINKESIQLPDSFPKFKTGENFFNIFSNYPNFVNFVTQAIAGETVTLDVPLGDHYFEFKIWPQRQQQQVKSLTCVGVDITHRKMIENKLFEKANFDSLTGLTNRSYFRDVLPPLFALAQRDNSKIALIYIDLDNFKAVNDTMGHEAGDTLLKDIAKTLKQTVRSSDIICRLGGDEFIIAAHCKKEIHDIAQFADKLRLNINTQLKNSSDTVMVTASIGISIFPKDGQDIAALIKKADSAMYASKGSGKNKIEFFNSDIDAKNSRRTQIISQLRTAIEKNEFTLNYQPKVSLPEQEISGVEALIRWNNETLGFVSPDEFIPIAEEAGLIIDIGNWVLNQACATISQFNTKHHQQLSVAINFSPIQFSDERILASISKALSLSKLPAELLEIEITESFLAENISSLREKLDWLSTQNINISLDDFGTGYSSLSYLSSLPFNVLKIDKSFIQALDDNKSNNKELVTAIIAMAKSLDLDIIAEGVETKQQLAFLQQRGVKKIQGYYFMPPVKIDEIPLNLKMNER